MKSDANPLHAANAAPRCKAKSKRSGQPCKNPAVRGYSVCRMHGARGGHGAGKANPAYKHGMRTREWVEMRKAINDFARTRSKTEEWLK